MLIENYVGIDVSKLSIDVFIRESHAHRQFQNEVTGFEQFIHWLKKQVGNSLDSVLICFEHTGLYSLPLALFLEQKHITYAMLCSSEHKNPSSDGLREKRFRPLYEAV